MSLQTVHATGMTYNDLKPANIMVSESKTILIDFNFCASYINDEGFHISEDEEVPEFRGNIIFASVR